MTSKKNDKEPKTTEIEAMLQEQIMRNKKLDETIKNFELLMASQIEAQRLQMETHRKEIEQMHAIIAEQTKIITQNINTKITDQSGKTEITNKIETNKTEETNTNFLNTLKVNPEDYINTNNHELLIKTTYAFENKFFEPLAKNQWLSYFAQACKSHSAWARNIARLDVNMKWPEFKEIFYSSIMGKHWHISIKNLIIRKRPQGNHNKAILDWIKEINELSDAIGLGQKDDYIVVHIKEHLTDQLQFIFLDTHDRQQIEQKMHTLNIPKTTKYTMTTTQATSAQTCSQCKKNHDEKDCWFKHPEKAPKSWKK